MPEMVWVLTSHHLKALVDGETGAFVDEDFLEGVFATPDAAAAYVRRHLGHDLTDWREELPDLLVATRRGDDRWKFMCQRWPVSQGDASSRGVAPSSTPR